MSKRALSILGDIDKMISLHPQIKNHYLHRKEFQILREYFSESNPKIEGAIKTSGKIPYRNYFIHLYVS